MINWAYLKRRLILLGVIWLFSVLALDPLLRLGFEFGASRALGAKVELGRLRTRFFPPSLRVEDFAAADPSEPMRNLVELKAGSLALETRPLFEKKFIVRAGELSGLAWDTPRKTSGAIAKAQPSPLVAKLTAWAKDSGGLAFERGKADVVGRYEVKPEDLGSVKLANDLKQRWPAAYDGLDKRIAQLDAPGNVKAIQQAVDQAGRSGNLPEKLAKAKEAGDRAATLKKGLDALRTDAQAQLDQSRRDMAAVQAARQADVDALARRLKLPSFDSERLSSYLLGPALAAKLAKALHLVDAARRKMPPAQSAPEPDPVRATGRTIPFPKLHSWPRFALARAALSGKADVGGPLDFSGEASDFASEPALWGRPAILQIKGEKGARRVSLEAILDHVTPEAKDQVALVYDGMAVSELKAGDPGSFSLTVSPGVANVTARVSLEGDRLGGKISIHENGVSVAPAFGGASQELAGALKGAFEGIKTLDADVELGGTLKDPTLKVDSNIGRAAANSLKGALGKELETRRKALEAQVDAQLKGRTDELNKLLAARGQDVLGKLGAGDQQVKALQDRLARELKVPSGLKLPGGLFR